MCFFGENQGRDGEHHCALILQVQITSTRYIMMVVDCFIYLFIIFFFEAATPWEVAEFANNRFGCVFPGNEEKNRLNTVNLSKYKNTKKIIKTKNKLIYSTHS